MKFTQAILKKNWLLRKLPRSKNWIVNDTFIWYLDYDTKKEFVEIYKWFKTDFGSIPKILQSIFSPTKYLAYILHDFLYSKNWIIKDINWKNIAYTRKIADQILREAMKVEWASFLERWLVYLGVRLGGFLFFKK